MFVFSKYSLEFHSAASVYILKCIHFLTIRRDCNEDGEEKKSNSKSNCDKKLTFMTIVPSRGNLPRL